MSTRGENAPLLDTPDQEDKKTRVKWLLALAVVIVITVLIILTFTVFIKDESSTPGTAPTPMPPALPASEKQILAPSGQPVPFIVSGFVNGTQQSFNTTVPGNIYTDLWNSGVIEDPYKGLNDWNYRWIAYSNWTYMKSFHVTSEDLSRPFIQLVSDGLDTIADVFLNDQLMFKCDNMFQRNRMDVKQYLVNGTNNLRIEFYSKLNHSQYLKDICNATESILCPAGETPWKQFEKGFPNVNYIRTEQCSFSWDWGPGFAPMGIWRALQLEALATPVVREILVETHPVGNEWIVNGSVFIDAGVTDVLNGAPVNKSNETFIGDLVIEIPGLHHTTTFYNVSVKGSTELRFNYSLTFSKSNVTEWYPYNYGTGPLLYQLDYSFRVAGLNLTFTKKTVKFGFRKVELVMNPETPMGRSFFFKVNGLTIPLHGSNWIPGHAFDNLVTDDVLRDVYIALQASNQNSLRVWGGGVYERDLFYSLADEFGILVFQDFMYAVQEYPCTPSFLDGAAKEARDNTRRLQYHPSIFIWAGNNENDGFFCWKGGAHTECYAKLYFDIVETNIRLFDTPQSRPFISSSPSNGMETRQQPCSYDPYSNDGAQSTYFGDRHFYNYIADCWDVNIYPRSRMSTEYGFQSWPSFLTLKQTIPESNWDWYSPMMLDRMHHNNATITGQGELENGIRMHYKWPNSNNKTVNFIQQLYLSQLYQAYCVKVETEYLRSTRSYCQPNPQNKSGCNLGQMYWQTNDIWPGASWSSLEYNQRWKMLHYYAKNFYEPVLPVAYFYENQYQIYLLNDNFAETTGQLIVELYAYNSTTGGVPIVSQNVSAFQESSLLVTTLPTISMPYGKENYVLYMKFTEVGDTTATGENWMFMGSPKLSTLLGNPNLSIMSVTKRGDPVTRFDVVVKTDGVAVGVWLETEKRGYFSKNGFLLRTPGEETIIFTAKRANLTKTELEASLTIWSLYDTMVGV